MTPAYKAFTNQGFLLRESLIAAKYLERGVSPTELSDLILTEDIFMLRSLQSRKTLSQAVLGRLAGQPDILLQLFISGGTDTQRLCNFYFILLKHRLLREFVREVLAEHLSRLLYRFGASTVTHFFERKLLEPAIASWSETTINKSRVNILATCQDAGLVKASGNVFEITPPLVPSDLKNALCAAGQQRYLALLLDSSYKEYVC